MWEVPLSASTQWPENFVYYFQGWVQAGRRGMEGGRGGGKLLLQGLRHSVLNARERMQREGRNFKSSSRILQRVGDLRYARCYVRKQEIQSRFPDSPLASSRNCHAFKYRLIQISRNRWNSFFFPTRVILYYCLRIVIYVFLFYFISFTLSPSSHHERFRFFHLIYF